MSPIAKVKLKLYIRQACIVILKLAGVLGLLLFISMFLTACSGTRNIPVVVDRTAIEIEDLPPLELLPVDWQVVTIKENEVLYSLDGQNFKNLSINFETVQSRLAIQNQIIKKQKEYYEPVNK